MKKILFIILSSVFVLIIPNVVNAETTGIDFQARRCAFNDQKYCTINLTSGALDWGDSTATFSFVATYGLVAPYTASLNMSNGEQYSCTFTSINANYYQAGGSNNIPSLFIISATCPFVYTSSSRPTSITFERIWADNNIDYLEVPQRMQVVKGIHFDSSSITNAQNGTTNAINGTTNAINGTTNAVNGTTNAVNGVNDSINNDNVSTNTENSSTASSWASQSASDSVVSDMVLMPITLLNAFSNGFNGTCSPYNLGSFFGTNLVLPCINISNYLGATLWGIIDVLMSGFLIYGIGKKFVRVFNDFTNLKDSQVDELYGGGNE